MAWAYFFIVTFSILIVIPAGWSIINLFRGNKALWPAVGGITFSAVLLIATFIAMITNWGGCPGKNEKTGTSEDAVLCAAGNTYTECKPDLWRVECKQSFLCPTPSTTPFPAPAPTPLPLGTFCPKGQTPVFDYCEHMQTGGVKQPAATWSDLGFVAAGLWLFWFFQYFERIGISPHGRRIIPPTADNPMIKVGWLSITYCLVVIFMGPPSMWYHASVKEWAGWFDSMSVVNWLFFNAAYVWYTICGPMWGRGRGMARPITVLCLWASVLITLGIIGGPFPHARLIFYFISGGLWGLAEVIYLLIAGVAPCVKFRRNGWLFFSNFLLLGLTMGIWIAFNRNIISPQACHLREAFPGHAWFHVLASFSTVLTFFSFASERKVEGSG